MIKTGIYKLDLFKKDTIFFRKKLKNASITLYDQVFNEPQADELAEYILLRFADERGAYKRTYQKRFEEFDSQVISVLHKIFTLPTVSFHDVGVSDGRTALDFFEKIILSFTGIQYLASDYNPSVFVLEKGKLKVTLSHKGKLLEILFPPFVFNKIKRDSFRYYPLNHLIRLLVEKIFVNKLVRQYQQGQIQAKELFLFAPRVLKKAQNDKRFKLGQHDLLQPFKQSVDIIRAMNILNPSYFSEIEFGDVIRNIYAGLKEGGILITGSNQEAGTLVHGGVYQKCGKVFKKLFISGSGSPIESLILTTVN